MQVMGLYFHILNIRFITGMCSLFLSFGPRDPFGVSRQNCLPCNTVQTPHTILNKACATESK